MRRFRVPHLVLRFLAVPLLAIGAVAFAHAYAAEIDYKKAAVVKAGFLRHIASLTTWPESKTTGQPCNGKPGCINPIVIGVVGNDDEGVTGVIRHQIKVRGKVLAQDRPLKLVVLPMPGSSKSRQLPKAIADCDVVFLAEEAAPHWPEIQNMIEGQPIVTVSDVNLFARRGGMIEYLIDKSDDASVRMIINVSALKRADLKLSSLLLNLKNAVTILRDEGGGE